MNFDENDSRQLLACVAALAGVGGVLSVLATKPRRLTPAGITLMCAFAALLAGGAMGVHGTVLTHVPWSDRLMIAGTLALIVGVMLNAAEGRSRDRAYKLAVAETESHRREVERLGGTNVRLEDELQEVRRRVVMLEKYGAENDPSRTNREAAALRQRKAMEAAVAGERKHRAIFEGAVEGMAILERETLRLVTVNPSLLKMTGFEAVELSQKTLVDLFAAGPSQPGKADLQRSAREGRPLSVEIQRKDGGVAFADVSITVIGTGGEAQLLTVVRDVSERRMLEQELQLNVTSLKERERRLEEANKELAERTGHIEEMNVRLQELQAQKDHFVSTVSHELRTPLTSIRSFSEILLQHDDTEPTVRREFMEIINKESERLTRLVNNVLDLARIEAGEARLEISEFDVRDVVADAIASMTGMASERKVSVKLDRTGAPRVLCGDRDKIQQLALNLVSNAIKFSPQGGEVEVTVKAAERPGRTELSVIDHGPGIPQGELERVFEKFRRADDAAGSVPGTGLGLAICREIAKLHGGRIWAESDPGDGSRFRVELPGAEESRRLVGQNRPIPKGPVPAAPTGRVLKVRTEAGASLPGTPMTILQPMPSDEEERSWTTTGTLPPLRMPSAVTGLSRDHSRGPKTGELPPIR